MRNYLSLISALFILFLGISCKENLQKNDDRKDTIKITVLQTADIHGQLDPHPELFWKNEKIVFKNRGGLANIKTLFERERAKNPEHTIIVDGGDLIQGSGYAALSKGEIMPDIIKAMNYDVLIPGNWEVVYGKEQMLSILDRYNTPIIAQNMFHQKNQKPLFPSYWVKEIEGIKIGFIGVNDPDIPIRQNPEFSKGIDFSGLNENLKEQIQQLKIDNEVDVLFLVTHFGIFKQTELANNPIAKDIDYILGNDTHERIRKPIKGKFAKVTEPGAFGSFVGKLEIEILNGKIVNDSYELLEVDPKKYDKNPEISKLIEKAKEPYKQEMERIIGYTNVPLYRYLTVENPMDNLITDAAKWKTGVDIAISNGFRFGNPVVPNNGNTAAITKANLWDWLPVNEKIKIGKVSGIQIKNWLEQEINNAFASNPNERFGGWLVRFSGMQIDFDINEKKGRRLNWVKVNGEPIRDEKLYSISACVRPGDPLNNLCRMANVKDVEVKNYTIHDAVEEYLKKFSPVSPKLEKRAYCKDLGQYSFSTIPNTNYEFH